MAVIGTQPAYLDFFFLAVIVRILGINMYIYKFYGENEN